jgi:hypothetical protein
MNVREFDSFEELMEAVQKDMKAANEAVSPEQENMQEGDHFIRLDHPFPIFGKIINPFQFYDDLRKSGKMDEEMEMEEKFERENRSRPDLKHVRFSMCYSVMCPEGEMGDTHIVNMHIKITEEQFNKAKEANWTIDIRTLLSS